MLSDVTSFAGLPLVECIISVMMGVKHQMKELHNKEHTVQL